jgi:hypothetical protein
MADPRKQAAENALGDFFVAAARGMYDGAEHF